MKCWRLLEYANRRNPPGASEDPSWREIWLEPGGVRRQDTVKTRHGERHEPRGWAPAVIGSNSPALPVTGWSFDNVPGLCPRPRYGDSSRARWSAGPWDLTDGFCWEPETRTRWDNTTTSLGQVKLGRDGRLSIYCKPHFLSSLSQSLIQGESEFSVKL